MVVVDGDGEAEKRRKNTSRENRKPRTKLIKQQRPWSSSQNIVDGDLIAPSTVASSGEDALRKLLLRRPCCCKAVSCFISSTKLQQSSEKLELREREKREKVTAKMDLGVASKKWGWVRRQFN